MEQLESSLGELVVPLQNLVKVCVILTEVLHSAIYCGKLGEVLVVRLARKNNGIAEAEHILWTFMASLTLVPFSLLLWGLGGTYGIHWFGMVFAQFTLSISNAIACPMALAYAISS